MFHVSTFICRPDKIIDDFLSLKSNIDDYFVEINNTSQLISMKNKLDFDYINGAIRLTYYEQILLDINLWDLVDQLWAYILNLIESLLKSGEGETYFPDQPVRLYLKSISQDFVLYLLQANKKIEVILPKKDFIKILLDGAELFFRKMEECYKDQCDYKYELKKIKTLRNDLCK